MAKSASFDVLGTCFQFTSAISAIETRLSAQLASSHVDAKSLFFSWFYAAQRDFTYLSIIGSYTPIAKILQSTLRRACLIVDLPVEDISDDDVSAVMEQITKLPPRPHLKTCFDGLKASGWDLYAVTNGGVDTSLGYFAKADIELDKDHLLSCDTIQTAKPAMKVYEVANDHLTARGLGTGEQRWFVAAHAWDLIAAKKAGFKTAYLDFEEHDPVSEVFGEFDIYAKSFEELLEKLQSYA